MGVTAGGLDLKDAILDGKDGHVEGAAAKVVDQHMLLTSDLRQNILLC